MLDEKQKELELQKWFDSEKAGKDTCGSYDYCKNCDKSHVIAQFLYQYWRFPPALSRFGGIKSSLHRVFHSGNKCSNRTDFSSYLQV